MLSSVLLKPSEKIKGSHLAVPPIVSQPLGYRVKIEICRIMAYLRSCGVRCSKNSDQVAAVGAM